MSDEDDVRDRLGARFDTETEDDPDAQPDPDPEPQPQPEDEDDEDDPEPKGPAFATDVTNVRESWDGIHIYFPSKMHLRIEKEYQRLAYETDWDFKKTRHYYPLLFFYGLSVIESLEGSEVIEYLRRMDL